MADESSTPVCPFCNDLLSMKLTGDMERNGRVYDIYYCGQCAIGTVNPLPSHKELANLYSFGSYRAASGAKFNRFLERLIYLFRLRRKNRIKTYCKRGRILDIGCGRGLFLAVMKEDGWEVTGTEFDEETAMSAARAHGIDVKTGNPQQWALPDGSFDVITINHALEHIRDAAEIVAACGRLLRKGGLLVIAVPNISSLQALTGKSAWFHLDVPYHLYHFSEKGLSGLLERSSFRIAGINRFDLEYGPFGWLQTLLNLSGIRQNLFYNLLRSHDFRKRELAEASATDILFTILLLPLYFPLSFALSLVESFLLKRGGTVEIYAVKK